MLRLINRLAVVHATATLQQVRGMAGKVIAKAAWDGWPRRSPDGWPYARYLKYKHKRSGKKGQALSKQQMARLDGTSAEFAAREMEARVRAKPAYEAAHSEEAAGPSVNVGGLRRRLAHTLAAAPPRL